MDKNGGSKLPHTQWASVAGDRHVDIIKWLIDYQYC